MQKEFTIDVEFDSEDNLPMWIAHCDVLPLTTEAETYEQLIERVGLIASDMAVENKHCALGEPFKLKFYPSPLPSPTRGEGSVTGIKPQSPPLPLWERVRVRGF